MIDSTIGKTLKKPVTNMRAVPSWITLVGALAT